jgi:hypothetical protein
MAHGFTANEGKALQGLTRKQVRAVLTSRKTKIDPKSSLARVSRVLPSYSCIGSLATDSFDERQEAFVALPPKRKAGHSKCQRVVCVEFNTAKHPVRWVTNGLKIAHSSARGDLACSAFLIRCITALLDAERLPELMRISPFSGYNRWNWTTYDERDHSGDARTELARASAAGRGAQRRAAAGRPDLLAYPSSLPRLLSSIRCRSITAAPVENLEWITAEVGSAQLLARRIQS